MNNKKINLNTYLIGIKTSNESREESIENLQELHQLTKTLKLNIIGSELITIKKINTAFYIGTGKINEIFNKIKNKNIKFIITDFELTPSQHRNWERKTKLEVIDRKGLILKIFNERAITKESTLQVALANAKGQLPKLKRTWTHLSRQFGKFKGARGEGERQLEIDRRLIKDKIKNLKKELKELDKHRLIQRSQRKNNDLKIGAIVGYTNAGKSSLLNLLSNNSNIRIDNKLFTTLDSTSKLIKIKDEKKIILTDTVGFIRKLPHILIEAFKSTLEEITIVDFLIHVVDISSISITKYIETTNSTLLELNSFNKPTLMVFNKIDQLTPDESNLIERLKNKYPNNSVFISVTKKIGIRSLLTKLEEYASQNILKFKIKISIKKQDIISKLYSNCNVFKTLAENNNMIMFVKSTKNKIINILKNKIDYKIIN